MNSLLLEAIQEIAIEMVVDPSFVEKDFYAVHVLSKIAEIQIPDLRQDLSDKDWLYHVLESFRSL